MSFGRLVASVLLCMSATTHATPVQFEIDYEVTYIESLRDPRVVVGDVYKGSFTVDSSLLMVDGINLTSRIWDFTTTFEDITWAQGQPDPASLFSGFRGPGGLGDVAPGVDVASGQVVNLRGGVYGSSDYPFIDYSLDAREPYFPNDPTCTSGAYCGNRPNFFWSNNPLGAFGGTMTVVASRVPEPETYALVAMGLGIVGFMSRRSRKVKGRAPSDPA